MYELEQAAPSWSVVLTEPGIQFLRFETLCCIHLRGVQVVESTRRCLEIEWEVIRQYGEMTQLMVFEASKMGRMNLAVRETAMTELKKMGERRRCAGVVVIGEGLGAQLMRSALKNGAMLMASSNRERIVETVSDGLDFVKTFPGQREAVQGLRAEPLQRFLGLK